MGKLTQWQHFKENYLNTAVILITAFALSLILDIIRGEDEMWWLSFIFLFIAVVVLPIGNYISWRKKQ